MKIYANLIHGSKSMIDNITHSADSSEILSLLLFVCLVISCIILICIPVDFSNIYFVETILFTFLVYNKAQALVHAHTQAQIAAGIYKGDDKLKQSETATNSANAQQATVGTQVVATRVEATSAIGVPNPVMKSSRLTATNMTAPATSIVAMNPNSIAVDGFIASAPAPSSSSPQFLAQLHGSLDKFWKRQLNSVHELKDQTEQDFKNHNDLPLARIKRIMKSDEDVRMISAEAPVLFAKACELFILDLSIRSWNYSQLHKRRTLQKEDIKEAIQKTDIFDFLVDVI